MAGKQWSVNPWARRKWLRDPRVWLESFVLLNLAFLSFDIWLAHSVNRFRHPAEYIPLYFSLAAPLLLVFGLLARGRWGRLAVWQDLGYLVGWSAIAIGMAGVVLHLDSGFFQERTIRSLVYAAPFAAPLAYTGLGLLLVMNRMVSDAEEWSYWVLLMALGGFAGNFAFSLTDHAQNGFYRASEWVPVVSSALSVGFLVSPFCTSAGRPFLRLCAGVLAVQSGVGLVGFYLHTSANLSGPSPRLWDNFVNGAPALAPLLFPNLALLAAIGLWTLDRESAGSDTDTAD